MDALKDLKKEHIFTMEGKEIKFKPVLWNDAIKSQNAIHLLATNIPENIDEGNKRLIKLALQYVIVNNMENLNEQNFSSQFENPFAIVELCAQFRDYILSFLNALPSFQQIKLA